MNLVGKGKQLFLYFWKKKKGCLDFVPSALESLRFTFEGMGFFFITKWPHVPVA